MSLITLIITLAVVGFLMWAINTYVPMEARFKQLMNIAVIIFVLIWLLSAFGLLGPLNSIRIGR